MRRILEYLPDKRSRLNVFGYLATLQASVSKDIQVSPHNSTLENWDAVVCWFRNSGELWDRIVSLASLWVSVSKEFLDIFSSLLVITWDAVVA